MRIAILEDHSGYKKLMLNICTRLGAEPIFLEWTQDIEKDLVQIRESDAEVVLIHGHPSHHGFNLADAIIDAGIGIEAAIVSSVSGFSRHYVLELQTSGDIHGSDFMAENAEAISRGAAISGFLQWTRWHVGQIGRHHTEASKALAEAEKLRMNMEAERNTFRKHLGVVSKRKMARD